MSEMDFNDSVGSGDFVNLEPGVYPFTVETFAKGRHSGSAALPACKKALVKIKVNGQAVIEEGFPLYETFAWKIHQFFVSLGATADAQGNVQMDWENCRGKGGMLKLSHRKYNDKDYMQVDEYLKPSGTYTPADGDGIGF